MKSSTAVRAGLVALTLEALTVPTFKVSSEEELHAAIAGELFGRLVSFDREWILGGGRSRIDFLIGRGCDAGIGLEIKVDGSPGEVRDQLLRYAREREIRHLILATTRRRLGRGIPDILAGVPVEVVHLRAPL